MSCGAVGYSRGSVEAPPDVGAGAWGWRGVIDVKCHSNPSGGAFCATIAPSATLAHPLARRMRLGGTQRWGKGAPRLDG